MYAHPYLSMHHVIMLMLLLLHKSHNTTRILFRLVSHMAGLKPRISLNQCILSLVNT